MADNSPPKVNIKAIKVGDKDFDNALPLKAGTDVTITFTQKGADNKEHTYELKGKVMDTEEPNNGISSNPQKKNPRIVINSIKDLDTKNTKDFGNKPDKVADDGLILRKTWLAKKEALEGALSEKPDNGPNVFQASISQLVAKPDAKQNERKAPELPPGYKEPPPRPKKGGRVAQNDATTLLENVMLSAVEIAQSLQTFGEKSGVRIAALDSNLKTPATPVSDKSKSIEV